MSPKPVVGSFDGVVEDALVGWIADLEHPDRLEPVICRDAAGWERAFLPFTPRHDVCNAFGITGCFGFAIPLHLLRGLEPPLSLHDATGAVLANAARIDLPHRPTGASGPCHIVLHIQKTAGTSLRTALAAAVRPGEALFLYPDASSGLSSREFARLPARQRAALRLVMGHVNFGISDALPGPSDYISFLREPEARLRSHYLHHLASGPTLQSGGAIHDLATAVSDAATDEFDNLMVRTIAGYPAVAAPIGEIDETHVSRALYNIRTRFRFLGIVERMQAHYTVLRHALRLPQAELAVENTSRISESRAEMRRVDWPEAMRRNRFDVMLYHRVQQEGLTGRDLAIR